MLVILKLRLQRPRAFPAYATLACLGGGFYLPEESFVTQLCARAFFALLLISCSFPNLLEKSVQMNLGIDHQILKTPTAHTHTQTLCEDRRLHLSPSGGHFSTCAVHNHMQGLIEFVNYRYGALLHHRSPGH